MSPDFLFYSQPPESDGAGLPFAPPPAKSFDEVFEDLALEDFDEDVQLPTPIYDLSIIRGSTPSLVSPSQYTFSTESTEDSATSEYSPTTTCSTSSYPSPLDFDFFDFDFGSVHSDVDSEHNSVLSDLPAFPDSFGPTQFSPAVSPYDHAVRAQYDDGSVGISPQTITAAFQSAAIGPLVYATPTTQTRTGPIRTKFICSHCGHQSARKHNLKTHMDTHNPNRKKPYVCPEGDCGHPFTRKHDLKRHLESMHGGLEK